MFYILLNKTSRINFTVILQDTGILALRYHQGLECDSADRVGLRRSTSSLSVRRLLVLEILRKNKCRNFSGRYVFLFPFYTQLRNNLSTEKVEVLLLSLLLSVECSKATLKREIPGGAKE